MERRCLLAIRIRGGVNASIEEEDTLRMLGMDRNNTATLIDDRPDYLGMLQKAKDRITWGEPTTETISQLLEKRGKIAGDKSLDSATLNALGYDSIQDLAEAIYACRDDFHRLDPIKPFFRLRPPRKGFKRTVKKPYRAGGELGYRGDEINGLASRMS